MDREGEEPDRTPAIMTDEELIQRARQGDGLAMRALHDRHASRVYSVVRRIVGDDELAEDCAQEAWIRALRSLDSFRGDARFSTWLHRIAVNSALQAVRRTTPRIDREEPLEEGIPDAHVERDPLLSRRLERALDRLPPGMRSVVVLHDIEGHTHDEIGGLLGIDPGTSKSQLSKARARLRDWLHDLSPGSEAGHENRRWNR